MSATIDPDNAHSVLVTVDASDCDQETILVYVSGLQDDQGNSLDLASVRYGKLIADVNADGVVNFADVGAVRADRTQATNQNNFRLDVNADGGVNTPDLAIVRQNRRHTLP
ncbi:MAG: hypothetical protein H0X40_06330 [Chthoniobacterales bacterium]|nr:hypothetical protein [Chthoniobacterales bacterium]